MRIQIIAPALPPKLDGIGDHSARLAAELARHADVTLLAARQNEIDVIPGVTVDPCFDPSRPGSTREILGRVRAAAPDWVVLQYNPFAYGRYGLNLTLPRVMRDVRRQLPETRFALMVHETYVPLINWRFAVMTTWQRHQLRRLCAAADLTMFSIEPWAARHRRHHPSQPCGHLPVGSNIPRVNIGRDEARARLGLPPDAMVLAIFGTAHPSRLLGHVRGAAEAARAGGVDARVLYLGPDGRAVRDELGDAIPSISDGPFPAEEVSRRLAAADVFLAPYVDGISTRRGGFMAGLQHGLPVVGTCGELTDPMLTAHDGHAFLLAPADDARRFHRLVLDLAADTGRRAALGHAAARLYHREFAWPAVAGRLLRWLEHPQSAGNERALPNKEHVAADWEPAPSRTYPAGLLEAAAAGRVANGVRE